MSYDKEKRAKVVSTGVEGPKATGKDNSPDASTRKGDMPPTSEVTNATVDEGAQYRAMEAQNNGNVLMLKLSQEKATAEARKRVNRGDGALNSDVGTHKG